jgi:hypothetical protein
LTAGINLIIIRLQFNIHLPKVVSEGISDREGWPGLKASADTSHTEVVWREYRRKSERWDD